MSETTLEIPDALFRRAKSAAAERGIPLRELVSEPLADKLRGNPADERPWMESFGKLRAVRGESARINRIIQEEFGSIEPEDLRDSRHERAVRHGRRRSSLQPILMHATELTIQ